ncbi:MAG: hypothetical protein MMC33_000733 [Icmadophila ericetorum]|nr:hypothetical protein [Icmadophila ericetorum]
MPLNFTAAHSSRITKSKSKHPLLKRASSSPFATTPRRKAVSRSQSKPEKESDDGVDRLDNVGLVTSLADGQPLSDVVLALDYIKNSAFDAVPERAGMNSTRIAEVLNFRKSLPPITTLAHVHAVVDSPTATEREVAHLMKKGVIRKVVIPGRGFGGSSISDVLILVKDWTALIRDANLDPSITEKYVEHLTSSPLALVIPQSLFTATEVTSLMRAGFLTSASRYLNSTNIFTRPSEGLSGTMTSIASISKAASGSVAAVGGSDALHQAGSGGSGGLSRELNSGHEIQLSLPSTGPFLRLLTFARSHMMDLLSKFKYKETPLYLLREKWDGGISSDEPGVRSAKYKGPFSEMLPGRTRKWKQFYGLRFDWVLAECLGAGLVEVFETGSVGRGVRAL